MRLSRERLLAEAEATGFRADVLEKAIGIIGLLESLRSHPFLKGRIALKGGTALNLFVFDLSRLSVDVDLNYVGAPDRETMLFERPKLEESIGQALAREGFNARFSPGEYAGGKWGLTFPSALGQTQTLELDLNFLFRVPLWPIVDRDSRAVGSYGAARIPVLDLHELAAGKLAALLSRKASRDLFDARQLLTQVKLDPERLRPALVVYGAIAKDWRAVSLDDVAFEPQELERRLLPLLTERTLDRLGPARELGKRLVEECRSGLSMALPLQSHEREFLDRLYDRGEIMPDLLTNDPALAERIRVNPGLQWQIEKLRKYGKGK